MVTPGAVTVSGIVATASAEGYDATVSNIGAVTISGIVATATAEGQDATIGNILAFITCSPATATAAALDVSVRGADGELEGVYFIMLAGMTQHQVQGVEVSVPSDNIHAQVRGVKTRNTYDD